MCLHLGRSTASHKIYRLGFVSGIVPLAEAASSLSQACASGVCFKLLLLIPLLLNYPDKGSF